VQKSEIIEDLTRDIFYFGPYINRSPPCLAAIQEGLVLIGWATIEEPRCSQMLKITTLLTLPPATQTCEIDARELERSIFESLNSFLAAPLGPGGKAPLTGQGERALWIHAS
jgi:hypothetical protein